VGLTSSDRSSGPLLRTILLSSICWKRTYAKNCAWVTVDLAPRPAMTSAFHCRVCHSTRNLERLEVGEMWFGSGETFAYELCADCGSLQLAGIPPNLGHYYPPEYFAAWDRSPGRVQRFRKRLAAVRNWCLLFAPGPMYSLLLNLPMLGSRSRIHPLASLRSRLRDRSASIADVGGGTGELLGALRSLGFRDLTCVDPYQPNRPCSDASRR